MHRSSRATPATFLTAAVLAGVSAGVPAGAAARGDEPHTSRSARTADPLPWNNGSTSPLSPIVPPGYSPGMRVGAVSNDGQAVTLVVGKPEHDWWDEDLFLHERSSRSTVLIDDATFGYDTSSWISSDGRQVTYSVREPCDTLCGAHLKRWDRGTRSGTYDSWRPNLYDVTPDARLLLVERLRDFGAPSFYAVLDAASEVEEQIDLAQPIAAAMSSDGRFIASIRWSDRQVRLLDREDGSTRPLSTTSLGRLGNGASSAVDISSSGRYTAFASEASDLVPGDTNGVSDVFVHDRRNGRTSRVSVSSTETQALSALRAGSGRAMISDNGRYVAFESTAYNLTRSDSNRAPDVFVRDRWAGTTHLVSTTPGGRPGSGSSHLAAMSVNGRHIAFSSAAPDITSSPSRYGVYVRDAGR